MKKRPNADHDYAASCTKKQKPQNIRKKQLLEANAEEDKTIKRLEKSLKLNKRNSKGSKKKISSGFIDDGLDYLLEVIDNKDGNHILSDDSSDLEHVPAVVRKKKILKQKSEQFDKGLQPKRQRTLTELLKEKGDHVSESDSESGNLADNEINDEEGKEEMELGESDCSDQASVKSNVETDDVNNDIDSKNSKPKIWEDIYGRIRDESGKVLKIPSTEQKYIPPSLRKSVPDDKKQEELLKIKRNLKGLLNRLSESNMQSICNQIEEQYMKHSRNDINETLFSLMSDLVLTPVLTPSRLIMEQSMLVALLHANVGAEVGAYFLQHLIEKLDLLFKCNVNYGDGKICNNVIIFISHLYNFKVTHSTLIFDIFRKLVDSFQIKDVELIQVFLKSIGFVLRKDDPLTLKEVIFSIQAKAPALKKEQNDSRISFMLDTLTAIRNNNIYKIPDYDPTIIDHSKKLLKGFVRKGCSLQELAVSYEDLLKADERGRWWIIGSAWSEREQSTSNENQKLHAPPKTEYSEKILQLAQKQHMNTDVRKAVFCIIMTAEDFMDAFEKLVKLNLKRQQEREIINVILHCVLQEKNYNPYYAYLAGKFCSFAREYQMSLQFSLWDRFKTFNQMKQHRLKNLAKFLGHSFTTGALPLSVLKVIHFSEIDKSMLYFVRIILLDILLHDSEEICLQVFKRISSGKNLALLRESLRLFMNLFIMKKLEKWPEYGDKLSERIKLADSVLRSQKNEFKL